MMQGKFCQESRDGRQTKKDFSRCGMLDKFSPFPQFLGEMSAIRPLDQNKLVFTLRQFSCSSNCRSMIIISSQFIQDLTYPIFPPKNLLPYF